MLYNTDCLKSSVFLKVITWSTLTLPFLREKFWWFTSDPSKIFTIKILHYIVVWVDIIIIIMLQIIMILKISLLDDINFVLGNPQIIILCSSIKSLLFYMYAYT